MRAIQSHVTALTAQALEGMAAVRRASGAPAVWIHGPAGVCDRGGTIAFNLLDDGGEVIDHEQVVNAAADAGICLRGGCFCNPGAAEYAFRYDAGELAAALDAVAGQVLAAGDACRPQQQASRRRPGLAGLREHVGRRDGATRVSRAVRHGPVFGPAATGGS